MNGLILVGGGAALGVFIMFFSGGARRGMRIGYPLAGSFGALLAMLPAAYVAEEPRLQIVVGLIDAVLFSAAWGAAVRDPNYQPPPMREIRWWENGYQLFGSNVRHYRKGAWQTKKVISSPAALTGAGIALAIVVVAATSGATLMARHEKEMGIVGLYMGAGVMVAFVGGAVAYFVGALVGWAVGKIFKA